MSMAMAASGGDRDQKIREAAYLIWLEEGCPSGRDVDHWLKAAERVALAEFEANAPALVHGHRPLIPAVAFQLVQPDALERAQVLQRLRDIERQQQVDRSVEIQPAKLVRPLAIPDLAARRIPPGPDHGKNILRKAVNDNR